MSTPLVRKGLTAVALLGITSSITLPLVRAAANTSKAATTSSESSNWSEAAAFADHGDHTADCDHEDDKRTPGPLLTASIAVAPPVATPPDSPPETDAAMALAMKAIREEGLQRSQVMTTIAHLTDGIGPRLTASPAMTEANRWTRDTMAAWGLKNAHLEEWGPFGRSWELRSFELALVEPSYTPLIAYPKAWSPATKGTITCEVVRFQATKEEDLEKYRGKLRGKAVLLVAERPLAPEFEPLASRWTEDELGKLSAAPTPTPTPTPVPEKPGKPSMASRRLLFLKEQGVAVILDNSGKGSGGTVFVAGASVPQDVPLSPPDTRGRTALQAYHQQAQDRTLPQVTLSTEHYNRLARLVAAGTAPKIQLKIEARFSTKNEMCANTLAEIPGSDLGEQVVMLGGHLDSWHAGTGATDNAAGAAVAMEAARIIQALGLKPRRTVRVALWSGEEQGLLGSHAYVKRHFAYLPNLADPAVTPLKKEAGYESLAVYFNLDNGTGKIRGINLQGNDAAAPLFARWIQDWKDLGVTTVAARNSGSTDHISFDRVGLPGFQFIQDRIEYSPRTHHSNQDVLDRIQADDMKQAATVMAAFVYRAAMMDERFPREPFPPAAPTPASPPAPVVATSPVASPVPNP